MDAGILPVKGLDQAKGRLGHDLGNGARADLARAMVADAFALCASVDFLSWLVVSPDLDVLRRAAALGLEPVHDPGEGLNAAISRAADAAMARGAESITIVPSDVPLARAEDVRDLVDTGVTSNVVVVPSEDGGTNGLYLRPPDLIAPRFGDSSLRAHATEAERVGVRCSILSLSRLELDLDTIEDVDRFLSLDYSGGTTRAVLERLRAGTRP